jgi:hypothetical protein
VVTATLESARDARTFAHAFLASGEDAQAAVFCGAAAAQRDLLGALAQISSPFQLEAASHASHGPGIH